ncbi:MAG: PilC/PilY family type IV pilus protein [Pseudomonadota bacterium]
MFTFTTKSRALLLTFLLAQATGLPLKADDTEVYLGDLAFSTNIRPNVLFILDTSGSMGDSLTVTTGTYDPATTYSGSCSSSRVYWNNSGNPPSCSTDNYFDTTSNVCNDSATALSAGGTGIYIGRLARYRIRANREDRWSSLNNNDHSSIVECEADYGVHGNGVSSDAYPADENDGGPYNPAAATPPFNWNTTGDSYTLYSANYLNWYYSPGTTTTMTKLEIVQDVLVNLVNSVSGINGALMRFDNRSGNSNQGGYFLLPMQAIDSSSRATFESTINALTDGGNTPLAETLYEAARYYRGEGVKFGNSTSPGTNVAGVLDPADATNSTYLSPIEYQCQQNFIVLLTDGEPTSDNNADTDIQNLPGLTTLAGSCNFNSGDDCLDELAHYLHGVDQIPDATMDDDQTVATYTIGFTTNQQLLQDTATKGGGKYKTADSAQELSTAFNQILSDILSVNTTFVAPAVPVNAFNRLTHRDELYFALFRPEKFPQWPGNLKRYKLTDTGIVDSTSPNALPAVDPATGFFAKGTTSFWTSGADAPDGDNVSKGGAAAELTLTRNMYTYTGASAPADIDLSASDYVFNESNALVTKTMLGDSGMSDAHRTELMQWARGIDVFDSDEDGDTTDARRQMGDPLHSNPVAVNYGGTNTNPDITIFLATNEGLLHAIDTTDGSEQFSFIPQELLPNFEIMYSNNGADSHPYGLDGPLTAWINDANNNGVVEDSSGNTESGEFVYLYMGMRRGGNNYYALDVTDRSAPVLKWIIQGGQGDFTHLAQTWSKMELAAIKSSGNKRQVLIFGGGYDVNQDDNTGIDSEGDAIYMIDADTGARLWWAGKSGSGANLTSADMKYGIPAPVMTGDINADGFTDIMFAVDMGGQVWRFDFNNSGSNTTIAGGVVAKLAGNGSDEHRRFYVKPDVSLIKINGVAYYAVAIGSGYRAHPLNTATQDRFHMLFFPDVYTPPANYNSPLDEDDLLDVTSDLTPDLSSSHGWRIDLDAGEKVLANSLTVDGTVYFTTYKPDANVANSCAPSQGVGRLYIINAYDARPIKNLDGVGSLDSLTVTDRYKTLTRGGIQPEPRLIFTDSDYPILVVGPQVIDEIDLLNPLKRTSWTD